MEVARLLANTRCHEVTVLDISALSDVTDFFVIGSGTSARQMRTVCDQAGELAEKLGSPPARVAGYEGDSWILLDCFDVVVHLFSTPARQYYDLEGLWGDAPRVPWRPGPGGPTAQPTA